MSSLTERTGSPSGTQLTLPADELGRLHAHACEGYPHEVVGILAGSRADTRVTRVVPLTNEHAHAPERRFRVDGLRLMRAEQALESEGLEVVGYYHSHPDHPANYSDTDREQALPNMAYIIAAVRGPAPTIAETRCWRLRADRSEMDLDDLLIR